MPTPPFLILAQCPPGLEPLVVGELAALGISGEPLEGGVRWSGGWRELLLANLHLRVASRVLIELGSFPVRALGELERKGAALPWGWIPDAEGVRFRVSASRSRLYHEGAIEERLRRAAGGLPEPGGQADRHGTSDSTGTSPGAGRSDPEAPFPLVVVRMHRDRCTVRLDSSGAHLHRRGYRLHVGEAPLRENLAAALLLSRGGAAGVQAPDSAPFLDPFCGAGTLAIEEALRLRRIPPGLADASRTPREYAFTRWTGFPEELWEGLVSEARGTIVPAAPVPLHASDRDARVVEAARENATRAGVAGDVEFAVAPLSQAPIPGGPAGEGPGSRGPLGWVVANPPYGTRLGSVRGLRALYASLGQALRPGGRLEGWSLALLSGNPGLAAATRLPLTEVFATRHGGLQVRGLVHRPGATDPGAPDPGVPGP